MEGVRVEGLPCSCPETPHETDWVELTPRPTVAIGAALHMAINLHGNNPILMQASLIESEVVNGIVAWSFTDLDEKGRRFPVPVQRDLPGWVDTVNRFLPFDMGGSAVANKADELYSKEILRPLVEALSKASESGPMGDSTSPIVRSGKKHPKRPKPSLQVVPEDGPPSVALAR